MIKGMLGSSAIGTGSSAGRGRPGCVLVWLLFAILWTNTGLTEARSIADLADERLSRLPDLDVDLASGDLTTRNFERLFSGRLLDISGLAASVDLDLTFVPLSAALPMLWAGALEAFTTTALWHLLQSRPSTCFIVALESLLVACNRHVSSGSALQTTSWHSSVWAFAGSLLALLKIRDAMCSGRRRVSKTVHACANLHPRDLAALARPGAASFIHVLDVVYLVKLQVSCFLFPDSRTSGQYLYQLGTGCSTYIGRGAVCRASGAVPGATRRYWEHNKPLLALSTGKVPRKVIERHRYGSLLRGNDGPLTMFVFKLTTTLLAPALEAAHIAYSLPKANSTIGAGKQAIGSPSSRRQRLSPRARRQRADKWKTTDVVANVVSRGPSFFEHSIDCLTARAMGHEIFLRNRHRTQCLLRRTFTSVYDHFLRLQILNSGRLGPVHLYQRGATALLTKYAILRPRVVNWSHAVSARGDKSDGFFVLWNFLRLVPNFHDKLRVQSSLEGHMSQVDVAPPRPIVVRLPMAGWLPLARVWMRSVLRGWAQEHPLWALSIRSSTRLVAGAMTPAKRAVANAALVTQNFDITDLATLDETSLGLAASGDDLQRLYIHGRAPIPSHGVYESEPVREACRGWLRFARLPSTFIQTLHESTFAPTTPDLGCLGSAHVQAAYAIQEAGDSIFCTVEDKDPNVLWIGQPLLMYTRWVAQLASASSRWRVTSSPLEQVVSWYRLLIDFALPRSLCRGSTQISLHSIPYVYISVKRKCWSPKPTLCPLDGTLKKHICTKPNHSCFRNIVSFVRMPCRPLMRRFGQALGFLIRTFTPGWAFTNLDVAFSELRSRVDSLEPPVLLGAAHVPQCIGCRKTMVSPGLVVADAGQAYEDLDRAAIDSSLDYIFTESSRRSESQTVFVTHGRPHTAGFGGSISMSYRDRTVFLVRSINRFVQAFLGMRLFRFGKQVLLQIKGIPIGGPLSDRILNAVLSFKEYTYDRSWPGRPRRVAPGRFADDLILLSRCKCSDCLMAMVREVYGSVVHFDRDLDFKILPCGTVVQDFLDGTIHFSFTSFSVAVVHKNETFAFSGIADDCAKHSTLPFSGLFDDLTKRQHRAELKGRIRRWRSAGADLPNMIILIATDCLLYVRLGFTFRQIYSIWKDILYEPHFCSVAELVIKIVQLTSTHLVLPMNEQISIAHSTTVTTSAQVLESGEAHRPTLSSPLLDMSWGKGHKGQGKGYNGGGWYDSGFGGAHHGKGYGRGGNNSQSGTIAGMAQQFSGLMSDVQAMAQMTQIGTMLAQQQQGGFGQTPQALGQPTANTSPTKEAAAGLAEALVQVVDNIAPKEDSKVAETVRRLSALAGHARAESASTSIETDPAFKRLKLEVESLTGKVDNHAQELGSIRNSVDRTATDVGAMRALLEQSLAGGPARGAPHGVAPGLPAGGGGLPPAHVHAELAPPHAPVAAVEGEGPLFGPMVDRATMEKVLPLIGVAATRREIQELLARVPVGGFPFNGWWQEMQRLKSIAQWRGKLINIGVDPGLVEHINMAQVGSLLYRRVADDLSISPADLQMAPPA